LGQELTRLFPSDAVEDVREADSLCIQPSLQGALVHRQLPGDIGQAAATVGQLSSDQFLYLAGQIERIASNQVSHKALDGNANLRIPTVEYVFEERFGKDHAIT
jgi:hypothetical protein